IRELRPLLGAADGTLRFAGQRHPTPLAKAEAADVAVEAILPKRKADPDRTDIRRVNHHVLEGDEAVSVVAVLVDLRIADLDETVPAVEDLRRRDHPFFESGGSGDDLERRPRLVHILHGAIAAILGREVAIAVWIKG